MLCFLLRVQVNPIRLCDVMLICITFPGIPSESALISKIIVFDKRWPNHKKPPARMGLKCNCMQGNRFNPRARWRSLTLSEKAVVIRGGSGCVLTFSSFAQWQYRSQ
ncbi:hypothetical protein E5288_WYG005867 [Bos mutus]|uniref:Uncharacterized protein n=1 Tax=Bos mutus TaxID=72004 RepID=A0A6B0R1A2_9CETA|nr:hypothetical protein [Bos mutus]